MSMPAPIVLLAGPHGSGKSSLGSRACTALDLRFLDLASLPLPEQRARLEAWARRKEDEPPADVVALPVELQAQTGALRLARRVGPLPQIGRRGEHCREVVCSTEDEGLLEG